MDNHGNFYQERTDSKLRYAKVHLEELASLPSLNGDDFDRAHQESFLFHLFGARDALLIELNHYYGLGLPIENLTPGRLREKLKARGVHSSELASLHALEQDDLSWFRQTKDMRDHSTHVQGIPRDFYCGGENDGVVKLRNPRTGVQTNGHFLDEFRKWYKQMCVLVGQLRESAIRHTQSVSNSPPRASPAP